MEYDDIDEIAKIGPLDPKIAEAIAETQKRLFGCTAIPQEYLSTDDKKLEEKFVCSCVKQGQVKEIIDLIFKKVSFILRDIGVMLRVEGSNSQVRQDNYYCGVTYVFSNHHSGGFPTKKYKLIVRALGQPSKNEFQFIFRISSGKEEDNGYAYKLIFTDVKNAYNEITEMINTLREVFRRVFFKYLVNPSNQTICTFGDHCEGENNNEQEKEKSHGWYIQDNLPQDAQEI